MSKFLYADYYQIGDGDLLKGVFGCYVCGKYFYGARHESLPTDNRPRCDGGCSLVALFSFEQSHHCDAAAVMCNMSPYEYLVSCK